MPDGGGEEAQRRVRANDAHFSSFVSNLFFEADAAAPPRRASA